MRRRGRGVEQQRPSRSWPRLREFLRCDHAEREASVDEPGGQLFNRSGPASHHLIEADLLGVPDSLLDAAEGAALEKVGRVDGVAGAAQLVGEANHAGSQPQCVVEEHYLGHLSTPPP